MTDREQVDPHQLGYCCRYANGQSCIGCGDDENGLDLDMLDLAMMIRRLVARVKKHEPDSEMCRQAITLLEKKGIKSWPLR